MVLDSFLDSVLEDPSEAGEDLVPSWEVEESLGGRSR